MIDKILKIKQIEFMFYNVFIAYINRYTLNPQVIL